MDYPGKVITKNQVTPSQTSASGVWTVDDAAAAVENNSWPVAGVPNPISRSLRFNSAVGAYLNRTPASAGNRKTWTWSGWVKRSALGGNYTIFAAYSANSDSGQLYVTFQSGDKIAVGWWNGEHATTAVFRDPSAWYHIVVAVDTTQATALNRTKVYVNGVAQTMTVNVGTSIPQNTDTAWNNNVSQTIGSHLPYTGWYFNGFQTEINAIDGQALDATYFGMTDPQTGAWIPKAYNGTYGTNGFYLNFSDNASTAALGTDYSGNSNTWTTNNFSVTAGAGNDSLTDVPTPWIAYNTTGDIGGVIRGNYATMNALQDSATLANGNLDVTSLSSYSGRKATMQLPTTGKWYWETTVSNTSTTGGNWFIFGMVTNSFTLTSAAIGAANTIAFGDRNDSVSGIFNETSTVFQSASINFAVNDILQCAYDADSGKFWFGKNNSWYDSSGTTTGDPATGSNQTLTASAKEWFPSFQGNNTSSAANMNFGQRPFSYTPPAGFLSLCTTNLPTPDILNGGDYFNTVEYPGTGSNKSVTGVGFQPDWVWVKDTTNANSPQLADVVRGFASDKGLQTTNTTAEGVNSALYGYISAVSSDGFSVAAGTDPSNGSAAVNASGDTYVAWNWKANGSGVTNTDGTITSSISVNTTSGFSIVTYSGNSVAGATVGHGLGATPAMIIVKSRTATSGYLNWGVYHQILGATKVIYLNTTGAESTAPGAWNDTAPTSSVFSLGNDGGFGFGISGQNYVAYCFAAVPGFSAFGSYTGNGSTDGPFVFTNHRPAFLLIKATGVAESWYMVDNARNTYNVVNLELNPNSSGAEATYTVADFLSNGFKLRQTDPGVNQSGQTYIYMAFAENPFKYSNAR